jgi:transcriptional regulator of acetoin/glycerol metabolism
MSTENKSSRRIFLMQVATSGLALIAVSNAQAQAMVVETDAQASSLGYKADATKVDKVKQPKYAAGQLCSNCALFQGAAGASAGLCAIFAGKQVAAKGWCSAYAKKA